MAESQNQGDKGRKPRPFGSFLLFLTVIVVVLVAFSGSALRNTQQFSQDEFLYHLVTGRVEQLKFKGQNGIEELSSRATRTSRACSRPRSRASPRTRPSGAR